MSDRQPPVAGRSGRVLAVLAPRGGPASPNGRAVDEVVVHERRHVHELDRRARRDGRGVIRRRGEEDESRPEALPAGRERARPHLGHEPGVAGHLAPQLGLDLAEVVVEPRGRAHDLESGQGFTATCSATMPPPRRR